MRHRRPTSPRACASPPTAARPLRIRNGGHSYGGWSAGSGLVADISKLNTIAVDTSSMTAKVGAGALLVDVYTQLAAANVSIGGGSCATVGITGLTLGGGQGVLSRAYGLTCDQLRSVDIVTADGKSRTVDAEHRARPVLGAARRRRRQLRRGQRADVRGQAGAADHHVLPAMAVDERGHRAERLAAVGADAAARDVDDLQAARPTRARDCG